MSEGKGPRTPDDPLMPWEGYLDPVGGLGALAGAPPERYVCMACGALLWSREAHVAWHEQHDGAERVAELREQCRAAFEAARGTETGGAR